MYVKNIIGRVSERHMRFSVSGKALLFLVLGSWFSRHLIPYWQWILLAALLLSLFYVTESVVRTLKRKKTPLGITYVGVLSLFLVMLFAGMQFTGLKYRTFLLLLGIGLTLPAAVDVLRPAP